ncbi:MAG TPA: MFS transporter, partial [Thermogutta sp.]|nr:MFS transporter [Thermogutta sp.]
MTFWLAYLSNALVSAGNVLLCRYADYVNFLGADEYHLGWIIGFGMVGSLFMRFALGSGIDRFGARRVWLLTILATALGCLIHLGITDYRGIAIYLARVFYIISLAGVFSASMTLMAARAPRERLAEVVGIYGSAGFAGVLLGAPLADLLFPAGITSMGEARLLFLTAGGMCLLSFPLAWFVPPERTGRPRVNQARTESLKTVRRSSVKEPGLFRILLRYTSVPILIAGIVAGAGLSVPPTFLPRYVAEFGVHSVSGFFFLYAATAIVIRGILLRRVSNPRLDRMILL